MKRFSKNVKTGQVDMVILEGAFTIGASGAVVADSLDGAGLTSVTLGVNPGKYAIKLEDPLNKFFMFNWCFTGSVASTIGSVQVLSETVASTKFVNLQCYDITGSAASPASGCTMRFVVQCRESGVLGKGE